MGGGKYGASTRRWLWAPARRRQVWCADKKVSVVRRREERGTGRGGKCREVAYEVGAGGGHEWAIGR